MGKGFGGDGEIDSSQSKSEKGFNRELLFN